MMNEDIEIRRLQECDWEILKSIRLEALQTSQSVFGQSLESASSQNEEGWREMLANPAEQVLFGMFDKNDIVGMTGAARWKKSPQDTVILFGTFLKPEYRKQGLSTMFYEARIGWAKEQPGITRIIVSHREGNEASRRANQKWGFRLCAAEDKTFGDGTADREYIYELRI